MNLSRRTTLITTGLLLLLLSLMIAFLWITPPDGWDKADAIGYAVCHRIPSHSFEVDGRPLPLCARCTGMYLGAIAGLVLLLPRRRAGFPSKWMLAILAVLLAAVAVDGVNSYLHFLPNPQHVYSPANWLRLVTGAGLGLTIGVILTAAFSQVVWSAPDARPALDTKQLALLAVALTLICLAVLSNLPFLILPLALLSVLSVILALSLIYTALWVMLLKRDNTFPTWRSLWLMLILGLDTAFVQILAFDLVRFSLTGTWGGFFI